MPRQASALASDFAGHLRYLDMTRRKMEHLFAQDLVVRRDIEQVYLGLFMDCMTSFERLIEDPFVGLMAGRLLLGNTPSRRLITFRSQRDVRPVIFGGRQYVDWIPYNQTINRARIFFHNGEPFTMLDTRERNFIEQCSIVRNAIAHKSDHSRKRFVESVLGNQRLMPRERYPAGYLRGVFRYAPIQTRYEHFAFSMAAITRKLCN